MHGFEFHRSAVECSIPSPGIGTQEMGATWLSYHVNSNVIVRDKSVCVTQNLYTPEFPRNLTM